MRGILIDSYYKAIAGMKLLLICLIFLGGIIISFIENQLIVEIYPALVFFTISIYSLLVNANDLELGWSIYELTLPIKRENILKSKYLIHLFWIFVASVISIVYLYGIVFVKGSSYFDLGIKDVISIFIISVSFSIQLCSWFYMILYIIDFSKKEAVIIISILLSICSTIFLVYILNRYGVDLEIGRIIMLMVSVLLVGFSYMISVRQYIKKEY